MDTKFYKSRESLERERIVNCDISVKFRTIFIVISFWNSIELTRACSAADSYFSNRKLIHVSSLEFILSIEFNIEIKSARRLKIRSTLNHFRDSIELRQIGIRILLSRIFTLEILATTCRLTAYKFVKTDSEQHKPWLKAYEAAMTCREMNLIVLKLQLIHTTHNFMNVDLQHLKLKLKIYFFFNSDFLLFHSAKL